MTTTIERCTQCGAKEGLEFSETPGGEYENYKCWHCGYEPFKNKKLNIDSVLKEMDKQFMREKRWSK